MSVTAAPVSVCRAVSCSSASPVSSGTSAAVTITVPVKSSGSAVRPARTAPPVPSWTSWTAVRIGRPSAVASASQACVTWSRSWPTTVTRNDGSVSAAARSAWASSVRPPIECSTFGVDDRIRVPAPAARTMTARGVLRTDGWLLLDVMPLLGAGDACGLADLGARSAGSIRAGCDSRAMLRRRLVVTDAARGRAERRLSPMYQPKAAIHAPPTVDLAPPIAAVAIVGPLSVAEGTLPSAALTGTIFATASGTVTASATADTAWGRPLVADAGRSHGTITTRSIPPWCNRQHF